MGRVDRTEYWEEGKYGRCHESLTQDGQRLSSFPVSHSHVVKHRFNRYGLIKMRELANKRLEQMGRVVFQ